MYVNSWMTLFKEIQLYMSALGRRDVYKMASIIKEISRDLCKVNAGMINVCTQSQIKFPPVFNTMCNAG